jgi:hypothetical protein
LTTTKKKDTPMKKLKLNRQTVRELSTIDLRRPLGAVDGDDTGFCTQRGQSLCAFGCSGLQAC